MIKEGTKIIRAVCITHTLTSNSGIPVEEPGKVLFFLKEKHVIFDFKN